MAKAFEVMTRSLATCARDERVGNVAAMMRDRNVGSVLILKDGTLDGIVTDRDLVVHALAGKDEPLLLPIRNYMSAPVITGEADWSMEHVSEVMAKHQIRRLPIVEDGQLTGIVSLGDVALHEDKQKVVAESLQAISSPTRESMFERLGHHKVVAGVALAASALTVFTLLAVNRAAPDWREKVMKSALYGEGKRSLKKARSRMETAATHDAAKQVRELRQQFRDKMDALATQAPALHLKPKRHFWSA